MRCVVQFVVLVAALPASASAADSSHRAWLPAATEQEPVSLAKPATAQEPVSLAKRATAQEPDVGLLDVQSLQPLEMSGAWLLPGAQRLQLAFPALAPSAGPSAGQSGLTLSPDVALQGASLTLRLVPTRSAPNADVPLVLLPRVAGVGSRWFGLDFAAWF
jgi:hypothetical protein